MSINDHNESEELLSSLYSDDEDNKHKESVGRKEELLSSPSLYNEDENNSHANKIFATRHIHASMYGYICSINTIVTK